MEYLNTCETIILMSIQLISGKWLYYMVVVFTCTVYIKYGLTNLYHVKDKLAMSSGHSRQSTCIQLSIIVVSICI